MTPTKQILTPREAAVLLGRSKSWVVERCQDGTLPALRIGNRWLLKRPNWSATAGSSPTVLGRSISRLPQSSDQMTRRHQRFDEGHQHDPA